MHNLLNGKQNWTHARRHWMKKRKHCSKGKKPQRTVVSFSRGSRLATPRRWKRTEKSNYNSSRRSFVRWFPTPRRWTLQGSQKSGKLHVRARRPILSRRKLKEKGGYNSFLPNFRPSFVTAQCWMLEQLK